MTPSTVRHTITSCWLQLSPHQRRPLYQQHRQLTTSRHLNVLTTARHSRSHGAQENETANRQRRTVKLLVHILIHSINQQQGRLIQWAQSSRAITCIFYCSVLCPHTQTICCHHNGVLFQAENVPKQSSLYLTVGVVDVPQTPDLIGRGPMLSISLPFRRLWRLERDPRQPLRAQCPKDVKTALSQCKHSQVPSSSSSLHARLLDVGGHWARYTAEHGRVRGLTYGYLPSHRSSPTKYEEYVAL